jgi:hypothetical protein
MSDTESLEMNVLFGSSERRGAWKVPAHIDARVTLGSLELDLRDADLGPATTIDANVTFGSIEILVPEDVGVEVDLDSLGASVDHVPRDERLMGLPPARTLRVIGKLRFGSCSVIPARRGIT